MGRAACEEQIRTQLQQELWATLTPLGKRVYRAKSRLAELSKEEGRRKGLQKIKRKG